MANKPGGKPAKNGSNQEVQRVQKELNLSQISARTLLSLPEEERSILFQRLVVSRQHSGPLPDGDTIQVYAQVIPNGGERLMRQVELESEHRKKMELEHVGLEKESLEIDKKGVNRTLNQRSTGQWMGFALALVFGFMAFYLITHGFETSGIILGSVDLVSLVGVFVLREFRNSKRKE